MNASAHRFTHAISTWRVNYFIRHFIAIVMFWSKTEFKHFQLDLMHSLYNFQSICVAYLWTRWMNEKKSLFKFIATILNITVLNKPDYFRDDFQSLPDSFVWNENLFKLGINWNSLRTNEDFSLIVFDVWLYKKERIA